MSSENRPSWYKPILFGNIVVETSTETHLSRLPLLGELIVQHLTTPALARESRVPLNILDVGPGYDACQIECPYEPYYIAGLLEGKGLDYRMTVVDKKRKVLADIASRKHIFEINRPLDDCIYTQQVHTLQRRALNEYTQNTGQPPQVIQELSEGLNFASWLKPYEKRKYLKEGVQMVGIPVSFRHMLESHQIDLLNDDIANPQIALKYNPYDLVVAQWVFTYMDEDSQKLALYHMARATRNGGIIIVNSTSGKNPLLKSLYAGWLGERELQDLGLKQIDRHEIEQTSVLVFQKEG